MRYLLLILYVLPLTGLAQIPGIQEQPKWAMPFYFEDANGERDTVWIGYDPDAQQGPNSPDPQFEKFKVKDSGFQAMLSPSYSYPYGSGSDSVKKVEVTKLLVKIDVSFLNGKMPVVMKWDNAQLNSDSLHWMDLSPRPKARIDVYCVNGEPNYNYCYWMQPQPPII